MERATRRIVKELKELQKSPIPGLILDDIDDITDWKVGIIGAEGTLYEGEKFTLSITFDKKYPIDAPTVVFLDPVPVHSHIYSNGHICLSVLYDEWSPAMGISSICLSILSMLSSAEKKERPADNKTYVAAWRLRKHGPKATSWDFHDSTA